MTSIRHYTVDDLLNLDLEGRAELENGELLLMAPAGSDHGGRAAPFVGELEPFTRRRKLGKVLIAEPAFRLSQDPDIVRVPDAAYVRRERLNAGGKLPKGAWEGAPDIALEVLSPTDRLSDVRRKIQLWLDSGTLMVVFVEPEPRTVTVYRPGIEPRVLREGDTLDAEGIVPGWSMPVSAFFED